MINPCDISIPGCLARQAAAAAELPVLPVWRASLRMAVVSVAGLVAAGLIATGISG